MIGIISGLISIILGIIILSFPKTLNYIVAAWLIIQGLLTILPRFIA
jgi:uncharacterized membrane protein HdeD (DUF308 family)